MDDLQSHEPRDGERLADGRKAGRLMQERADRGRSKNRPYKCAK